MAALNNELKELILNKTGAMEVDEVTLIQNLWSNYGEILRVSLRGGDRDSVVVKHVKLPDSGGHPRGWDSANSHNRKIKSYEVETQWYREWAADCDNSCRVPFCIDLERIGEEVVIIMEDLNEAGFPLRKSSVDLKQIKLCIKWLGGFHGTFLGRKPDGLWDKGTYWHIDTRPDELKALEDRDLKNAAWNIDKKLEDSSFKTIVHGDAKLANFCFSLDSTSVAAVDFQYVGGGVGVKDLAYFIGSCLYEVECESLESELLDCYFNALKISVEKHHPEVNFKDLEKSWRELYPVAWTDFHRFLKGWSPGHWKINSYSERLTRRVLDSL